MFGTTTIPPMTVLVMAALETATWEDGEAGRKADGDVGNREGREGEGVCGEAIGATFVSGLRKGHEERLNDAKMILCSYLIVIVGKEPVGKEHSS
jgi:hypothetical protein